MKEKAGCDVPMMCHAVPTCGNIAVCQLCRKRQSLFRTAALLSTKLIYSGWPAQRDAYVFISVFFCGWASNAPDPMANTTALKRTWATNFSQWMKRWRRLSMLSSMWLHVATLPFVSYAEKDRAFPDSILFSTKVIFAGLPIKAFPPNQAKETSSKGKHQCAFLVVSKAKGKDSPKAQPKGYFPTKEHDRATDSSARMSEPRTRLSMLCSMRVHVATLAFVSYAKKDKALSRQHPCSRDDLFRFA